MTALDSALARKDIAHHLHPQTNLRLHEQVGPLVMERGEGIYVFDTQGQRFIEGMSGLWCATLGFSQPRLAQAAYQQLLTLPYQQTFAHRTTQPVIDLATALIERAPSTLSKVIFQSSGSEAIDSAIKLVRYYHTAIGQPQKHRLIARQRGYHGTTLAAASLTGLPNMHKGWGDPLADVIHDALPAPVSPGSARGERRSLQHAPGRRAGTDHPQARPGNHRRVLRRTGDGHRRRHRPAHRLLRQDPGRAAQVRHPAGGRRGDLRLRPYRALLGLPGHGPETGHADLRQGLSAAFQPISALLISDTIYQAIADQSNVLGGFGHGYTYGGHPVAAAVALETLALYDELDILGNVAAVAPRFQAGVRAFADHPLIGEARGIGLMAALEFVADKDSREPFPAHLKVAARVAEALQRRGVLLRALGDTLVMAPPLIIDAAQVEVILTAVAESLDEVYAELAQ